MGTHGLFSIYHSERDVIVTGGATEPARSAERRLQAISGAIVGRSALCRREEDDLQDWATADNRGKSEARVSPSS